MGMEADGFADNVYAKWALSLSVIVVLAFGATAYFYAVGQQKVVNRMTTDEGNEYYFTARKSKGMTVIAWSFFASAMGSWVITAVPDYAFWGGWLGLFWYSFSAGFPLLLIALFGNNIQARFPKVLSFTDYCRQRFGPCTMVLSTLLTLFNMFVASSAEYSGVASLMRIFLQLGDYSIFFVLLLGVVTLTYTTIGGLSVSMLTDRLQGIFAVSVFLVVLIYIAAVFRVPFGLDYFTSQDPLFQEQLSIGFGDVGTSSFFVMPLSLTCATVFSEAMWQRVWAGVDASVVTKGATMGATMVFLVCFLIGMTGILGGYAYGPDIMGFYDTPDFANLRLFFVLSPVQYNTTSDGIVPVPEFKGYIQSVVGVIIMMLTVTMSESGIDSMQNGIASSLNGVVAPYMKPSTARVFGRVCVVLLNIPMIVVGVMRTQVLKLFLITNMVCCMAAFPMMLGLSRNPFLDTYLGDYVPLLSFICSFFCISGYGMSDIPDATFGQGVKMAFYDNFYSWKYFAVAFGSSIGWTLVFVLLNKVLGIKRSPTADSHVNNGTKSATHLRDDREIEVTQADDQARVPPPKTLSIEETSTVTQI